MNLDHKNARSGRFPETSDAASDPRGACENGKICLQFKATDFVVYSAHGVGQILSIDEQTVAGASMEFFVIFFTKSKLTVRVPVRKAANMRKPSDLSSVQGVKQISERSSPERPRQLVPACAGIRKQDLLRRYRRDRGGRSRSFPAG